jgi:hypothetical protein
MTVRAGPTTRVVGGEPYLQAHSRWRSGDLWMGSHPDMESERKQLWVSNRASPEDV